MRLLRSTVIMLHTRGIKSNKWLLSDAPTLALRYAAKPSVMFKDENDDA